MADASKLSADFSTLSDVKIFEYIKSGKVVVSPLIKENVNTSSVDVTLGRYYFREQTPSAGKAVYSPWSESDIKRIWGDPIVAEKASVASKKNGIGVPEGVNKDDYIIWIGPGETILGHTKEYIGGRHGVTTMMKARSSLGRSFIEVCKCAGWGDVGYINRWTMEITNNSRHYWIPLVVGRRIAQIVFFEVGECLGEDYSKDGKYQTSSDLKLIQKKWSPYEMLPKMYNDREIKR